MSGESSNGPIDFLEGHMRLPLHRMTDRPGPPRSDDAPSLLTSRGESIRIDPESGWVNVHELIERIFGTHPQSFMPRLEGAGNQPKLGKDLRFIDDGSEGSKSWFIHPDDVLPLLEREVLYEVLTVGGYVVRPTQHNPEGWVRASEELTAEIQAYFHELEIDI